MRKSMVAVLVVVLGLGVGAYWGLHLLSGLIPGHTASRSEGAADDFARRTSGMVRAIIDADMSQTEIPIVTAEDGVPTHVFWGATAATEAGACVVNMRDAYFSASVALKDRSGVRYQLPSDMYGCDDFAVVYPPAVPERFVAWGMLGRDVRHPCRPTISAGAVTQDDAGRFSRDLSVATVYRLATAEALAEGISLGVGPEQIAFEPLQTLQCDGFNLLQLKATASSWPPEGRD